MEVIAGGAMLNALHYYWITAKGYRLRPWASPYLRWRLETFFGTQAANLGPAGFVALFWRERARMRRFFVWVDEMQHIPRPPW